MSFSISSFDAECTGRGRHGARLFMWGFLVFFALVAAAYWATRAYFTRTGDLLPMREAALALHRRAPGCLYRNVISSRTHFLFKHELLNARKTMPEVITLGSSRMLYFHRGMFSRSFLNMARAANRASDALHTLQRLRKAARPPRLVIVGVDFWWFHPKRARHPGQAASPRDIDPENFSDVLRMLQKGLENPAYLTRPWRTGGCNLGVDAILHERGFDRWGHMYMGHQPASATRAGFADTLARIRENQNRGEFAGAQEPDMERLAQFTAELKRLRARGTFVVAFMPPLPARVRQAMVRQGTYGYIETVRAALRDSGIPYMDYDSPPRARVFSDCQFLDGFHQGDTANAAILLDLLEQYPPLAAFLNRPFLQWLARHRNNALVMNSIRLRRNEEDFLGFGCRKTPVGALLASMP